MCVLTSSLCNSTFHGGSILGGLFCGAGLDFFFDLVAAPPVAAGGCETVFSFSLIRLPPGKLLITIGIIAPRTKNRPPPICPATDPKARAREAGQAVPPLAARRLRIECLAMPYPPPLTAGAMG